MGDYWERNTKVYYYDLHTNALGQVDITFDLQVTNTDQNSVYYTCTPSDLEQTWAVGAVRKEKHDSFASEEEFKEYLLTAGNGFPIIKSGAADGNLMYDCEWAMLTPGDYLLYAVACYSDGWSCEILSDLTYVPFTIKERTFSDASVELPLIVYDGDELVAYDPEQYPASTYAGKAAVNIVATPDPSCAEYYVCTQNRPASAMEGLSPDTLIGVIQAYGQQVSGNSPATFGVILSWNYNNVCALSVGVDSNGIGSSRLEQARARAVYVPRDAGSGRFAPHQRTGCHAAPDGRRRAAGHEASNGRQAAGRPEAGNRREPRPQADRAGRRQVLHPGRAQAGKRVRQSQRFQRPLILPAVRPKHGRNSRTLRWPPCSRYGGRHVLQRNLSQKLCTGETSERKNKSDISRHAGPLPLQKHSSKYLIRYFV